MNSLTILGLLPLVGSAAVFLLPKGSDLLAKQVALGVSIVVAIAGLGMALSFDRSATGFQFVEKYQWIPAFGINYALGVDGISLLLILLALILTPIVIAACWNEAEGGRWSVKNFFGLILILETMIVGVFAATDIFLFYVFFEAMLIPVYFLIGGYGTGEKAAAAVKFLLYSLFGGLLMLASIIGLYVISGNQLGAPTFDITALSQLTIDPVTQRMLFLGFFIAFAIKAPLWPFHTWLPDAARAATPGTSVLLLGVLDKVGTYGMIRFCLSLFPEASKEFGPTIIVLSLISIFYGAFLAIAQGTSSGDGNIKALISYTSISHFGFITLGIFAFTQQSHSGATLYMISRRKSEQISDFGGLQRVTPIMAWTFFIAGMSSLALPGLSSFVSEFLVLIGTFERYPIPAIIGTIGIILAALYILIPVQRALHGPTTPGNENLTDLTLREKISIAPVIAIIIFFGFYPQPLLDVINPAANETLSALEITGIPGITGGK